MREEVLKVVNKPTPPIDKNPGLMKGIINRFGQVIAIVALQAAILFLAAGRLDWAWAWLFLALYLLGISVNSVFMLRHSPETIVERGQAKWAKDWDKALGGAWSMMQFLLLPLLAGLDMRYAWSGELGVGWHIAGAAVFAVGLALFGWAMVSNAYFSTAVRIQDDRGQTVCRTGPYQFVRHPGYVGTVLQSLGIPLLLGSWWALSPGLIAALLMMLRTALEDRTLQAELPGYRDYAREVRFRLVPGLW